MRGWQGIIVPLGLVVAAELAASTMQKNAFAPSRILVACLRVLEDGSLVVGAAQTLVTAGAGLLIGAGAGLAGGFVLGLAPRLAALSGLSIETLRAIPAIAILPLSLLIFGRGHRVEIATVAFACSWPMLIGTSRALARADDRLLDVARLMRLGVLATFSEIMFPPAASRVVDALRIATALALTTAVAVEVVINPLGFGRSLMLAQESLRPDRMFAMLLYFGVIAVVFDLVLRRIGRALAVDRSGAEEIG